MTRADVVPVQAETDEKFLALWLQGRSPATARAYEMGARRFFGVVAKPLSAVTLGDLRVYADSLADLAPASRARLLASAESLFAFAHRIGYLPSDVARVLRLPKVKATLPERIMSEKQVVRMIGDKSDEETTLAARNRATVTLLYAAGLRVSDLCALKWRDAQDRSDGEGQITAHGKGGKTRVVRLPAPVWGDLLELRGDAESDDPVFHSRKGGHPDQSAVNRIVHAAAMGAGIKAGVSPRWLRHAHASHAIERGAPIHLVHATLGHASVATTGRYLHARPSESSSKFLLI